MQYLGLEKGEVIAVHKSKVRKGGCVSQDLERKWKELTNAVDFSR